MFQVFKRGFHTSRPVLGYLKGINPLLSADLLRVLRSAGHGDEIAIVDGNFPAASTALDCVEEDVIQMAGADAVQSLDAICAHFPLDYFDENPVLYMSPSKGTDYPDLGKQVHTEGNAVISEHSPGINIQPLERFAFYSRAKEAYAIVQASGERRPYGNWILKKGCIGQDGKDLKP
mmetsp:Transcript_5746/g.10945  ORF Transcript_5746/g.10945 Transcript_5746/m.10945 type:complete len:176 (+) Transcript_5746:14-541(+)